MRKHLIGTFRTRAFRLRTWKFLNAIVAVVTVANVSLVGTLIAPTIAEAADTGWNFPTANAVLSATVTNPANAYADDGANAVFNSTGDHKYGNFNISIPVGSTVNGIQVVVQGCASSGNDKDLDIYISDNNGSSWGTGQDANNFDTNCDTITLGGSNDKWGRANWTIGELANGTFAIRIDNDFSSGTVGVDYVAVKVFYTAPVGGSGSIWTTNGDCGTVNQDVNHFSVGDHVYINGSNFTPNTSFPWNITGQPGGASNDPNQQVASGNYATDANGNFCFDAYTVLWDDGGEYNVNYGTKQDNYGVDEGTLRVVKKLDSDGNGSFETTNPAAFKWGFNGGSVNRTMGSEVDVVSGSYTVTENSVDGYHFVGWYVDEGSCTDLDGTTLPAMTSIGKNDTDVVTLCNAKDEVKEPVTINAWKIVCPDESMLPNWGDGGPNITATTASSWLADHQACSLASDWNFQWAPSNGANPGDNTGAAGSPWTTFGPTNVNGKATATIDDLGNNSSLWFREVWDSAYVPFSGDTDGNDGWNDVSAEVYCHTDVLNYDNYDRIDGVQQGGTYNCVAWNVAARQPQGTLVVHKQADTDGNGSYELTVTDTEGGFGWQIQGDSEWSTFGSSKNLTPDTYTVLEKDVTGYHMTGWVYGSPDGDICGGDVKLNDGNPQVSVADNQETHITFCNRVNPTPTGSIHGQKFNDLNGNGVRDCSFPVDSFSTQSLVPIGQECEPSLNGWTIFIDANDNGALDQGEQSMQTQFHDGPYFDDNGWYWFEGLEYGTYKVCEVQQTDWNQTYPINANNNCHTITVPQGGEGDTCFNPLTRQLDVVENAVIGPTCNFGNMFVPVTTINLVKDGPATVNAGDNITYTLNWSVSGNTAATNATITDPIPANTTFVSADNGGTLQGNVVVWNLGTKNPGQNGTVSVTVKSASPVTDGTLVTNTATFDTDQTDPKLDDANTTLHFTPPSTPLVLGATTEPNLTITKSVNKDTAKPGDILTYTITVTSTGTGDAENVIVTDTLPDDFSFAEGSGKTRTWDLGTLAPGQSSVINVDVRVESDAVKGDYINVATVDADGVDQKQASVTVAVSTPQVLGLATTGSSALDYFVFVAGAFLAAFGLVGLKLRRTTPIRVRK